MILHIISRQNLSHSFFLTFCRVIMEGDRLLKGEDVVTDDLLHLVADHIIEQYEYHFTDGPVNLPWREYSMPSKTNYQVIISVYKLRGILDASCFRLFKE